MTVSGLRIVLGFLDHNTQVELLAAVREVFRQAPVYTPRMPRTGKPMSVRMSNCGPLGWITDERGYRYEPNHPETGAPWPPMPRLLLDAWQRLMDRKGHAASVVRSPPPCGEGLGVGPFFD